MPAPKGNQYAKGNKGGRPTKWTLEKSLELGEELIEWMKSSDDNIFWEKFIVVERELYPQIPHELSKKHPEFSELLERAKRIQEFKVLESAMANKSNAMISKLFLSQHHGYSDKLDQTVKSQVSISDVLTALENE